MPYEINQGTTNCTVDSCLSSHWYSREAFTPSAGLSGKGGDQQTREGAGAQVTHSLAIRALGKTLVTLSVSSTKHQSSTSLDCEPSEIHECVTANTKSDTYSSLSGCSPYTSSSLVSVLKHSLHSTSQVPLDPSMLCLSTHLHLSSQIQLEPRTLTDVS